MISISFLCSLTSQLLLADCLICSLFHWLLTLFEHSLQDLQHIGRVSDLLDISEILDISRLILEPFQIVSYQMDILAALAFNQDHTVVISILSKRSDCSLLADIAGEHQHQ